jgi:glycosyltransferase involved in cell wall biosynthesis
MPVTFTVVIPTHNRRERLLQAIQSVQGQTRPAAQIIVVADGCTDGSVDAARAMGDPRIVVLDLPKAPLMGWGSRNEALRIAEGDVISYLGDDDLYLPDHLERIGVLHDTEDFAFVQANTIVAMPDGRVHPMHLDWGVPALKQRFESRELNRNPMASGSHRRGLAEKAGGWNPAPPDGVEGDADLFRRILKLDPATVFVSEPTVLIVNERFGDRSEQAAALLDEMSTATGLALLRARAGTEGNRIQDHFEQIADQRSVEQLEYAELMRRSETLDRIIAGRWWKLRRRLDPVIRLARRAGPRRRTGSP